MNFGATCPWRVTDAVEADSGIGEFADIFLRKAKIATMIISVMTKLVGVDSRACVEGRPTRVSSLFSTRAGLWEK